MSKHFATKACLIVLAVSCGTNDRSERTQQTPSGLFLNSLSEPIFLNNSSELRCDALKSFYSEFADQVMDGSKISNYSCVDRSSDKDAYSVKLEIKHGDNTAVIAQEVSDQMVSDPEFCGLPFDAAPDAKCLSQPFYFSADGTRTLGALQSGLQDLREYLQTLINQPQTKDLAHGMDTTDFAKLWSSRFDGTMKHSLRSSEGPLDFWIKLSPDARDPKTGSAQIIDANVKAFELGKSFFFCGDKECLLSREYQYEFNGHRLVLLTPKGEILTLYMARPE
ncbi:MAG: hypothetical protein M3Q07_13380 [Pseudobdellovibrionaceae bacterium]|nr:hypothetical protein [Pseudobdellovibrionaceae bacterium]